MIKIIFILARSTLFIWLCYEWYVAPDLSTIENIILTLIIFIGFSGVKKDD